MVIIMLGQRQSEILQLLVNVAEMRETGFLVDTDDLGVRIGHYRSLHFLKPLTLLADRLVLQGHICVNHYLIHILPTRTNQGNHSSRFYASCICVPRGCARQCILLVLV